MYLEGRVGYSFNQVKQTHMMQQILTEVHLLPLQILSLQSQELRAVSHNKRQYTIGSVICCRTHS